MAQVVLNRVKDKRFPNTVCEVVKQKGQFPWARKKGMNNGKAKLALRVSQGVYPNYVGNSHYFNHYTSSWNRKLVVRIGRHKFYE